MDIRRAAAGIARRCGGLEGRRYSPVIPWIVVLRQPLFYAEAMLYFSIFLKLYCVLMYSNPMDL